MCIFKNFSNLLEYNSADKKIKLEHHYTNVKYGRLNFQQLILIYNI